MESESKPWYLSRTIWGAVLAVAGAAIPLIGKMGAEALTGDIVQVAGGIAAVIGGAIAIYGRYKATLPTK